MYLTIWRHGEAGVASNDRLRELTVTGVDDIGFGCQRFHEHCEARGVPHPSQILYSEWQRTTQTAILIARAYNHARLQPCDALIPGRRPADVDAMLAALADATVADTEHVLLVSHQPLVSALVDHYQGERARAPGLVPGGLATLALETPAQGCGRLLFVAQPPDFEVWR
jgi:phosphohistidine phosphatase